MKKKLSLLFLLCCISLFSQQKDYYANKSYLIDGYDVVSYFKNKKILKGNKKFETVFDDIKLKFSSQENLNLFLATPKKYFPQYGGYCAYAVAKKNIKMESDVETFEIRDGKLYLFYNSWLSNKLEDWQQENTTELIKKVNKNWNKLKYTNE